ncbi:MAG: alpha/beta hydrolase [Alphaproteobacteria bacterium]|jgi:pimeloyl-ACP methyl ester carboxylesterase|nr:alpha/beta hydrolase [Alphaproteobacteria bacterium]
MGDASGVRTVTADDGIELHYEIVAQNATSAGRRALPVVLLHGALAGRRTFSRQHQALASLGRLIIPSARGHDGSDPTLSGDYGIDTSEVRDIAAILAAEGVERLHLIGHSSGGAIAFAFARAFPDLIERLVLIEPALFTLMPEGALDSIPHVGPEIMQAAETGDTKAMLRAFLEAAMGPAWLEFDDDTQSQQIAKIAKMAPFIAAHLRALRRFAVGPADLKALGPPTLLFYGEDSFDFETKIAAQWLTHRPDLELILVEGAGHNVHRERSDLVNAAICGFLDG